MGSAILRAAHARQMDFSRIEYDSETGESEVPHSAQVIRRKGDPEEAQFYPLLISAFGHQTSNFAGP